MRIVIIVAMKEEALPFIERHELVEMVPSPFEPGMPFRTFSGVIEEVEVGPLHLSIAA
jgi:hypothetical protein